MDLRSRLRRATACEHGRLEQAMDLLAAPISKPRFVYTLSRFHGFYSVWEASIRRHASFAEMLDGREKLGWVRSDLAALGLCGTEIDRLPRCWEALDLVTTEARAAGSLYVIEGSSLGGQVISRTLSTETWAPAGGFRYFSAYGPDTASRWREFRQWLETRSSPESDPEIQNGAMETFDVLRRWMAPGP
jgi:heme oxygenase